MDRLLAALRDPPPILAELARVPGLYLVGGWLRKAWRGEQTADLDLIAAEPLEPTLERIAELTGGEPFALNERFATRRVIAGEYTLDVSALADGGLDADIARRDYTVNTLVVALSDIGPAVLPVAVRGHYLALPDLRDGVLRMVDRANLVADPLRILRGYRLVATEGYSVDYATRETWRELAASAALPAAERLHDELLRICGARGCADALELCADDGVLWELLPPLRALTTCEAAGSPPDSFAAADMSASVDPPEGAPASVWTHTLECLRQLDVLLDALPEPLAPWAAQLDEAWRAPVSGSASVGTLTRLALLLHDVAKPPTRELQPDGRLTFHGHQEVGAELAQPLLQRLKLSSAEIDYVLLLIREHLRLGYYSDHDPLPPRLVYRYLNRLGDAAPLMLLHSIADCAATHADWAAAAYGQHVRAAAQILRHHYDDDGVARPPLLLDGTAIMALLEIRPGPLVGELKGALLEATAAGEVGTVEQAEQFVREQYAAKQASGE